MRYLRFIRYLAALVVALTFSTAAASKKNAKVNPAVTPVPQSDFWLQQRFEGMNDRVRQGNADLVFIGDSITHSWDDAGMGIWHKFYGRRNAVNLGISGDQTENVLWRLDHGNIDGISPKLAVVMIGTNNAANAHNTSEETAEGIKAIVERLRTKLPRTKILLLGIFPARPESSRSHPTGQCQDQRDHLKLADEKVVFYLDIGPRFVRPDGTLSKDIMVDLLHLGVKGYEIWAEAIEPSGGETDGGEIVPVPLLSFRLL